MAESVKASGAALANAADGLKRDGVRRFERKRPDF